MNLENSNVQNNLYRSNQCCLNCLPPSAVAEAAAIVRPTTKFCESADSQFTVETNGFLKVEFRADSMMEANILVLI